MVVVVILMLLASVPRMKAAEKDVAIWKRTWGTHRFREANGKDRENEKARTQMSDGATSSCGYGFLLSNEI